MKKFLYLSMFLAFFGGFCTKIHSLNTNHNNNLHNANNNNNNNSNSIDNTQYDSKTSYKDLVNSKIKSMEKTDSISQKTSKVLVDNWDEKNMLSYSYDIIYGGYNSDGTYTNNIKYTASGYTNQNYVLGENNANIKGHNGAYVASSDITNLKVHLNYNYQPTAKVIIYSKYLQLIKLQALSSYKNPQKIWYSIDATGILTCPKITLNEHLVGDDGKEQKFAIGYFNIYNFYNTNGSWSITLMSILAPPILLKTALTLSSLVGTSVMCGMCFWCKLLEITDDYTINANMLNEFEKNDSQEFHNSTEVGSDVIDEKNDKLNFEDSIHSDNSNSGLLKNDTAITHTYDSNNSIEESTSSLKFQDSYQVELIEVCYFSELERDPVLGMENDKTTTKITKPNNKEDEIKTLTTSDKQEITGSFQSGVKNDRSNLQQEWAHQDEQQKALEDEYSSWISFEQKSNEDWHRWYEQNEALKLKEEELWKRELVRRSNYEIEERKRIESVNQEAARINDELYNQYIEYMRIISEYHQKIQNEYDLRKELRIQMDNEREQFYRNKHIIQERMQIEKAPEHMREILKDKFELEERQAILYFNENQDQLSDAFEKNKLKAKTKNNEEYEQYKSEFEAILWVRDSLVKKISKSLLNNNSEHENFLQKLFERKLLNIGLSEEEREADSSILEDLIIEENKRLTSEREQIEALNFELKMIDKIFQQKTDIICGRCYELKDKLRQLSNDNEHIRYDRDIRRNEYKISLDYHSESEMKSSKNNNSKNSNNKKLQSASNSLTNRWKSLQDKSQNLLTNWRQKVREYNNLCTKIKKIYKECFVSEIFGRYIRLSNSFEKVKSFKDEIIAKESTDENPISYQTIDHYYIKELKKKWLNKFYSENPEYTLFRNNEELFIYSEENGEETLVEDNTNANLNFQQLYNEEMELRKKFKLMKKMKVKIIELNNSRDGFIKINKSARAKLINRKHNYRKPPYPNEKNRWNFNEFGFTPKSLKTEILQQHNDLIQQFHDPWIQNLLSPKSNAIVNDLEFDGDNYYYIPSVNHMIQIINSCSDKIIFDLEEYYRNYILIRNEFLELIDEKSFDSFEYAEDVINDYINFSEKSSKNIMFNFIEILSDYSDLNIALNELYKDTFNEQTCEKITNDLNIENFYLLKNRFSKIIEYLNITFSIKLDLFSNKLDLLLNQYEYSWKNHQFLLEARNEIVNPFANSQTRNEFNNITSDLYKERESLWKFKDLSKKFERIKNKNIEEIVDANYRYKFFSSKIIDSLESEIEILNAKIKYSLGDSDLINRLKRLEMEYIDWKKISDDIDMLIVHIFEWVDFHRYTLIKESVISVSMPIPA